MIDVLSSRELPAWTEPERLFLAGPARDENCFWLDAGTDAVDGWSWVGTGTPTGGPPPDLDVTRTLAPPDEGGPFRGGWVGWLGYDAAAASVGAPASGEDGVAHTAGLLVTRFVAFEHATRRVWAWAPHGDLDEFVVEVARWQDHDIAAPVEVGTGRSPDVAHHARARHDPAEYVALIERCRDAIRDGDAYQLCLTTRFDVSASVDPVAAFLRLRTATPSHHGGLVRVGPHALVSASPERFLEIGGGIVRTRPIKGTRPRGTDPASDHALAADLAGSVKERAENVMIVDLMRNDLQRVCDPGTVAVERLLEVETYAAVHQLVSTVAGRLRSGSTLSDVLTAVFPAGSMTGAPKLAAMRILHSLENAPRGVFAGCFGWVGADGRADLAMVIRSIVIHPHGAYVGAGGGITWRSVPADEVAEVAIKARGPLAAAGALLPADW